MDPFSGQNGFIFGSKMNPFQVKNALENAFENPGKHLIKWNIPFISCEGQLMLLT